MSDAVEDIKTRLDIVDVIREYIPLAQAGGNFRARCPFHEEKTPSFMVSRQKQLWYCFGGCNEGGDLFKFVMKHEGMEFAEALRYLANKAGVELARQDPRVQGEKTRLLDLMHAASLYYQQALERAPQVAHARAYLEQRHIDRVAIQEFWIGAALSDPGALSAYLLSKKYTAHEIIQAGLALQKERGYGLVDRFRNRIMIPIRDIRGSVIGFGGRTLEEGTQAAKYLNSPQTPLYDKSGVVYNLDAAKQEIRARDCAIIVEGYMDVIAVWGSGMKNVVASSGTALTVNQIRLLARFTKHVLFSFDMDAAGLAATQRGIELALHEGMDVKVIVLPTDAQGRKKYKDPDECIRANADAWKDSVDHARSFIQFRMDTVLTPSIHNDAFEKKRATREVLSSIALLPDRIEQDHWIRALGDRVTISEQVLWEELLKMSNSSSGKQQNVSSPGAAAQGPANRTRLVREELLLAALLKHPPLLFTVVPLVTEKMFLASASQELYRMLVPLLETMRESPDMIEEMVRATCTGGEVDRLLLLADKEWSESTQKDMCANGEMLAHAIRSEYARAEVVRLQQCMQQAEKQGDTEAVALFTRQFHDLQNM